MAPLVARGRCGPALWLLGGVAPCAARVVAARRPRATGQPLRLGVPCRDRAASGEHRQRDRGRSGGGAQGAGAGGVTRKRLATSGERGALVRLYHITGPAGRYVVQWGPTGARR